MTIRIPTPRLLPATIAMLALVLGAKSINLVRALITNGPITAMIPADLTTGAWASTPAEKPDVKTSKTDAKKPAAEPLKTEEAPPVIETPSTVSDSEKAVLLDLRERRGQLEAREATLTARESMLSAAEQKLSSRVEELQGLQKQLESLDASHKQQEDVAWQGLVKVYETMKPRDAAVIFNDLAMPVLVSMVDRMKEAKAAAILAAMSPDKARDVTTQLAQTRTKAASPPDPASGPPGPSARGPMPGSGLGKAPGAT
jgi:flagellar motility protein MotE (MotC chaperone)